MIFYEQMVMTWSNKFGLDSRWVSAIMTQESNNNAYAIRYESKYNYLFQVEEFAKKMNVSVPTEMMCQKASWGLGQIMGALAREQGFDQPLGMLFIPDNNIEHLCIRLAALKKISPLEEDVFAMYNGGPGMIHKKDGVYLNQAYVDGVNRHLQKL